ncbi:hypothetical protein KY330_00055 [Candidatus Woesearchaeota archaeon]|nr:hypothetical protein [Candidatus Woesearchaeota archaeon]
MKIVGRRKDDLLEDALNDSFFEFKEKKGLHKSALGDVVSTGGLMWEPSIGDDQGRKETLDFNLSMARLKEKGFVRHPRYDECLNVINAYSCHDEVHPGVRSLGQEMVSSKAEWLCQAFDVHYANTPLGKQLILEVYENLGQTFVHIMHFYLGDIVTGVTYSIEDLSMHIVRYFTKSVDNLSKEFFKEARIFIPLAGSGFCEMARSGINIVKAYTVPVNGQELEVAASRGVKDHEG